MVGEISIDKFVNFGKFDESRDHDLYGTHITKGEKKTTRRRKKLDFAASPLPASAVPSRVLACCPRSNMFSIGMEMHVASR